MEFDNYMETYSYNNIGCDKVLFTSDTHFWHKNILKYEPVNRPFKDVFEMNEQMISRWNSVVGSNDLVFHLGDFAFSGKEQIRSIVSRLNGKIVLLLGNHDRDMGNVDWKELGFYDFIKEPSIVGGRFIISHEPLESIPSGKINLYGHVHGKKEFNTFDSNRMCVCVERWNCTPVSFDRIKEQFSK